MPYCYGRYGNILNFAQQFSVCQYIRPSHHWSDTIFHGEKKDYRKERLIMLKPMGATAEIPVFSWNQACPLISYQLGHELGL